MTTYPWTYEQAWEAGRQKIEGMSYPSPQAATQAILNAARVKQMCSALDEARRIHPAECQGEGCRFCELLRCLDGA